MSLFINNFLTRQLAPIPTPTSNITDSPTVSGSIVSTNSSQGSDKSSKTRVFESKDFYGCFRFEFEFETVVDTPFFESLSIKEKAQILTSEIQRVSELQLRSANREQLLLKKITVIDEQLSSILSEINNSGNDTKKSLELSKTYTSLLEKKASLTKEYELAHNEAVAYKLILDDFNVTLCEFNMGRGTSNGQVDTGLMCTALYNMPILNTPTATTPPTTTPNLMYPTES